MADSRGVDPDVAMTTGLAWRAALALTAALALNRCGGLHCCCAGKGRTLEPPQPGLSAMERDPPSKVQWRAPGGSGGSTRRGQTLAPAAAVIASRRLRTTASIASSSPNRFTAEPTPTPLAPAAKARGTVTAESPDAQSTGSERSQP